MTINDMVCHSNAYWHSATFVWGEWATTIPKASKSGGFLGRRKTDARA
jgi:hypothetical protein